VGEMRTGVRRVRFQPILAPERGPPFGLSSVRTFRLVRRPGLEPSHSLHRKMTERRQARVYSKVLVEENKKIC